MTQLAKTQGPLQLKHFDGVLYYSAPASDGAMCKVGEITQVHVFKDDFDNLETFRVYCTDGWAEKMLEVKRFNKNEFEALAKKYLNTEY